jgi:hypothetical protein
MTHSLPRLSGLGLELFSSVVLIIMLGQRAKAVDFCALTVDIQDSTGGPAKLTHVQLVDPTGKVVFQDQVEGSTLRICDFGFGEHKLVVGNPRCYPNTVSGIRLRLDEPIHLTVRLNWCPRDHFAGNLCSVYLRVQDQAGKPVPQATLSWDRISAKALSDEVGRVEAPLVSGQSVVATVSKSGYSTETIPISCTDGRAVELRVLLRPRAR